MKSLLTLWTPNDKTNYVAYMSRSFPNMSAHSALEYIILIGLLTGYIVYLKSKKVSEYKAEVEDNLNKSRIINLKYQLQPHFLFNSLQTISNLIRVNKNKADEAIANLSDILRFSINQLNSDSVKLKKEIEITEKYLSFQKVRFGDSIDFSINLEQSTSEAVVPSLILQPLVENSIKHGFETSGRSILIIIRAYIQGDKIVLEVRDNGPGFETNYYEKKNSNGLKNLTNRLKYFYDNAFDFIVENLPEGSSVKIIIPHIHDKI
ncbi:MAG: histidine kinase [Bacteroidota bacterium]